MDGQKQSECGQVKKISPSLISTLLAPLPHLHPKLVRVDGGCLHISHISSKSLRSRLLCPVLLLALVASAESLRRCFHEGLRGSERRPLSPNGVKSGFLSGVAVRWCPLIRSARPFVVCRERRAPSPLHALFFFISLSPPFLKGASIFLRRRRRKVLMASLGSRSLSFSGGGALLRGRKKRGQRRVTYNANAAVESEERELSLAEKGREKRAAHFFPCPIPPRQVLFPPLL